MPLQYYMRNIKRNLFYKHRSVISGKPVIKQERARNFNRVVFICGLHRSGTTLLEQVIQSQLEVAVLRGPVPENEGQHLQNVFPQAISFGGPGKFAFAKEMVPDMPGSIAEAKEIQTRLLSQWTPWVSGSEQILLEKSPPNLTKIAWLRNVFPGARFIIMTRDPRAVAGATQKWAHSSIAELVFHWHVAHDIALKNMSDEDCLHIRYEDFCSDPSHHLDKIYTFTEIPRRPTPASMDERFNKINASNDKYLTHFKLINLGSGSWNKLGYDFI